MLKRRMYHFMSRLRRYTFLALIPGQPYLQKRAVTEREAIARMSCVDCHIVIVIVIVTAREAIARMSCVDRHTVTVTVTVKKKNDVEVGAWFCSFQKPKSR